MDQVAVLECWLLSEVVLDDADGLEVLDPVASKVATEQPCVVVFEATVDAGDDLPLVEREVCFDHSYLDEVLEVNLSSQELLDSLKS